MTHDRVFAASLTVSILFHLSMVTLFSIVLMFERHDLKYVDFELVQVDKPKVSDEALPADRLELRGPDQALAALQNPLDDLNAIKSDLGLAPAPPAGSMLPRIELPKLEFAELERLRLRQEGLGASSGLNRFLEPKPQDPWARFGRELGQLTDALVRFRRSEDLPEEVPVESEAHLVSRPAPGFKAFIEWMSEPKDRIVLSTPPIRALWGRRPGELDEPITLIFTVNPDGRVVEVLNPVEDELTTSVGIALSKYRFAPLLESEGTGDQQGTFRIVADEEM